MSFASEVVISNASVINIAYLDWNRFFQVYRVDGKLDVEHFQYGFVSYSGCIDVGGSHSVCISLLSLEQEVHLS